MAAVATRSQGPPSNPTSRINSPIDAKRNLAVEDSKRNPSPKVANRDMSKASPKKTVKRSPSRPATSLPPAATESTNKTTSTTSTTTAAPQNTQAPSLPPPPPPAGGVPAVTEEAPSDYFSGVHHNKYGEEPNPFEQSFSVNDVLTPGKALLPPASSITSPSPNLGTGSTFNWGINSLRSGPLSPAMLTGPSNVFDPSIRTGLTPNESGIRSGLTPGGGGSMFPVVTPGTQALFGFGSGTTPGTMEFHKTALAAQAASNRNKFASMVPPVAKSEDDLNMKTNGQGISHGRQASDPFAGGDANAAASGLYMLAQQGQQHQNDSSFNGGNTLPTSLAAVAQGISMPQLPDNIGLGIEPQLASTNIKAHKGRQQSVSNGLGNGRGVSEASDMTGNSDSTDGNANGRGAKGKAANKKGVTKAAVGTRRKADDQKGPTPKKQKQKSLSLDGMDDDDDDPMDQDDDDMKNELGADGKKMTDDEKRKNFLERNRVAALKCRQRKKQWLANLQAKVEYYGAENDALNSQVANLRDEIIQLKTLLLAHKECPVNQSAAVRALTGVDGIGGMGQAGDYQMHHYGVQQSSMAPPNRRFS